MFGRLDFFSISFRLIIVPKSALKLIDLDLAVITELLFGLLGPFTCLTNYWLCMASSVSVIGLFFLIKEFLNEFGIAAFRRVEKKSAFLVLSE